MVGICDLKIIFCTGVKYLEKARAMFEEMDLQWDLDELDKVVASN